MRFDQSSQPHTASGEAVGTTHQPPVRRRRATLPCLVLATALLTLPDQRWASAQAPTQTPPSTVAPAAPAGYTIGTDDVLTIVFWKEPEMSGDAVVRPDGRISLPLLDEIHAAGLTPAELRVELERAAAKFVRDPNATVVVKQINSLKVFITGMVDRPGGYPITARMTVLQLIALAGGLEEYADRERIVVVRLQDGRQTSYRFNYKEVAQQKRIEQNLELRAGDTVLVP